MENQYSKTLKSMMKAKPSLFARIVILVLIAIAVLGCVKSISAERRSVEAQKENVMPFNPNGVEQSYSELTIQLMSEEFAANYNDTIYYCLAVDVGFNTYIIAVKADQMDQFREMIDYTYSDAETTPPNSITLRGMPRAIEEDLVGYTLEAVNVFWGSDVVDETNYQQVIGGYYLDTTQGPASGSGGFVVYLILAVILCLLYAMINMRYEKSGKTRKATLEKYDSRALYEVDLELNKPDTLHYFGQKIHLTERFIVSTANGFDIVPYEGVQQIYGLRRLKARAGAFRSLVAITQDGVHHEIAVAKLDEQSDLLLEQIVDRIKSVRPDIPYGASEESFYIVARKDNGSSLNIGEDTGAGKSNLLLGIPGAVIGAALGGAIWVVLGEIGFIAGLAGFLMMVFAIKGYQILSGRLDKKGQIISLVIAFLMIFASNWLLYALEYCKGYYDSNFSFYNIMASIKAMPEFLKVSEVSASFFKDLAIGYLLSIWASYRLIGAVLFHKSEESEENDK